MNKETIELITQYIVATAEDYNGISDDAYAILGHLMQADRNLASVFCDIYEQIKPEGARYKIDSNNSDNESYDEE
jgi:hypothetical protein